MMIEMLNVAANWAKVKAGLKGGDRFKGGSTGTKFKFQKAPEMTKEANPVLGSVFGGAKGFSSRKK